MQPKFTFYEKNTVSGNFTVACENSANTSKTSATGKNATEQIERAIEKARQEAMQIAYSWDYTDETDNATSQKSYFASITAPDSAAPDFPDGNETMTIVLRFVDGSEDVLLELSDGQFSNPAIDVKFDDGSIFKIFRVKTFRWR